MLVRVPGVLSAGQVAAARARLAAAAWGDGRATAGPQSALAKRNRQLAADDPAGLAVQATMLAALEQNPLFFSAALPKRVFPPLFNRYGGALDRFGAHVDNAVRFVPGARHERVRTDVSATDLVLYPGTSVHRVEPVTRGERLACFFWIESMVRSDEQRRLLFEMDRHLMRLRETVGETDPAVIGLTGTYHNLLRFWADA